MSYRLFVSSSYHNPDNFLIGLLQSVFAKPSYIFDGFLHTFGHDPVSSVELLAPQVHVVS